MENPNLTDAQTEAARPARLWSRRAALSVLATSMAGGLLAACSPSAPAASPTSAPAAAATKPAAAPTTAPAAATTAPAAATKPAAVATTAPAAAPTAAQAASQPKKGGTLRYGMVGDPATLDGTFSPANVDITWAAFDRLTAYDESFKPQPMLAESWDLSPDSKKITLHLRKGVTFHDGREFTSDDVVFNLKNIQSGKSFNGQIQKQSNWWTTIENPDKYTLTLASDQSRPALFDFFEYFNIQDPALLQSGDTKSKQNGTGPYQLVEWVQGDHLLYKRNPNYWQSGIPYLDQVQFQILQDSQATLVQFQAGALDAIIPQVRDWQTLKSDPKYKTFIHNNTGAVTTIGVSVPKAPWSDKRLRQAINYAIDRQRYHDAVMLGTGNIGSLPWPQSSPAYDATKNNFYTFDLDKAKSLLQQVGVTDLTGDCLIVQGNQEVSDFAQIFQGDLAQIGIKLNIQNMQQAAWLDAVNNVKYSGTWFGGIAFTQLEPSTALLSSRGLDPTNNSSGFVSDQYTTLVNQSAAEPDPAKRKALYDQINDLFLDESFLMVLGNSPTRLLATAKLNGVTPTLHGTLSLTSAWLA